MKVLFLTTVLPRKKRMGSEVASQAIIDALRDNGNDVRVVGYMKKDDSFELSPGEVCVGSRYIETKRSKLYPLYWLTLSFLKRLPYSAAKYWSHVYIENAKSLLAKQEYDAVFIDHSQLGWLLRISELRNVGERVVAIAHNVEHDMYRQFAEADTNVLGRWIYRREAELVERVEIALANAVKEVWTLTTDDASFFSRIKTNGRVKVLSLPSAIGTATLGNIAKRYDIALIGSWAWRANAEALRWFLDTVYPHLPAKLSISVAGAGASWLAGRYPNIDYCGFVLDAEEFLMQARVVAIPTLSGGGIQIKTLDAIASGSPIVATTLALRGIDDPPRTVAIADTSREFAALLSATAAEPEESRDCEEARSWSRLREKQFRGQVNSWVHKVVQSCK